MPHHTASSAAARIGRLVRLAGLFALTASLAVHAQTISTASTTKQTLSTGTLTVTATGSLTVTGNNVAVTVTGSSSIVNLGTIQQTSVLSGGNAGNSRAIRDNTGGLTLSITNGSITNSTALIQTADADVIQMKQPTSSVTLFNYGTLNSQNSSAGGNQALDWNALDGTGTNIVHNFSTGIITATNADAVRPGVNGQIFNDGLIKSTATTDTGSDGIDAQTNTGVSITNAATVASGTIEGARHGITGGNTTTGVYAMSITNNLGGTIQGDNGSGINIDGINGSETVTIVNHGTITGNGVTGDGDGVDVDGLVNLTNTGTIRSLNSHGDVSEGVTVGGGTITNSGTIEGSINAGDNTGTGRGITIAGVDKDSNDNPIPVQAPYAATTIHNEAGGLIKGDSDSGIAFTSALTSGFSHTITNDAGATIQGGGTLVAAIVTGADPVEIDNSGTIDGSSSGKAIAGGTGNLTVKILGGSASVLGDITGGSGVNALTFDLGAANHAFSHTGGISNFSTVSILSGQVTLAGTISLAGGTNTLTVASGSLLSPGAGALTIAGGATTVDGTLSFALNGATAGTNYGELVFGSGAGLTLNSDSTLQLVLGFTPTLGEQFELVNLLNGNISGTFGGLAEGSFITADGATFEVSYVGGTGNDLTLTVTAVPEPATTAALLGAGAALGALILRRRRASAVVSVDEKFR